MAGCVPAIQASSPAEDVRGEGVGGQDTPGHGVSGIVQCSVCTTRSAEPDSRGLDPPIHAFSGADRVRGRRWMPTDRRPAMTPKGEFVTSRPIRSCSITSTGQPWIKSGHDEQRSACLDLNTSVELFHNPSLRSVLAKPKPARAVPNRRSDVGSGTPDVGGVVGPPTVSSPKTVQTGDLGSPVLGSLKMPRRCPTRCLPSRRR